MASTDLPGNGDDDGRVPADSPGYYARSGAYPPNLHPLQESRAFSRGPAPRTVALACVLIVAAGVVNGLLTLLPPDAPTAAGGPEVWWQVLGAIFAGGLALILARFLRKGAGIARVVLAIVAGLNLAGALLAPFALAGSAVGTGTMVLGGLSGALVILAAVLTFTPSARAFFTRSGFSA